MTWETTIGLYKITKNSSKNKYLTKYYNMTEPTPKELLNAYRRDNILKEDKIKGLRQKIRELEASILAKDAQITKITSEREYYKVKVSKKSGWFF